MESGGSMEARVERLEREVEEHRLALRRLGSGAGGREGARDVGEVRSGRGESGGRIETGRSRGARSRGTRSGLGRFGGWRPELPFEVGDLRSGEWWLNKVGIALLLFGVAFLFKFSLDRGWLTPAVTVGIGLAIGFVLLGLGLRLHRRRRAFGQVLVGGGVGTLYITGFAAFQVYDLLSYPVALASMVAVTLLAFLLSLRQNDAPLSIIGTLGGLGTPFLLYTEEGSLAGLVLYTCVILAGASAIYLYKGWRSLLIVGFAGVWSVFGVGYESAAFPDAPGVEKWALQLGVISAWLALWIVPAVREALRERDPERWSLPEFGGLLRDLFRDDERISNSGAHAAAFAGPLLALAFTHGIWDLEQTRLGWISLGAAVAYALVSGVMHSLSGTRISYTQALVALLLGTLALVFLLDGNALLFTLAAEAAALRFVSRRLSDRVLSLESHALFAISGLWLAARLAQGYLDGILGGGQPEQPFFNVGMLVDLSVVALAFASSTALSSPHSRVYRTVGHGAVLALISREFTTLPDGETWTFISWALYAAGLHLLSRRVPEWSTVRGAHLLWGVLGAWLCARVISAESKGLVAVFNLHGIVDLAAILLAIAASFLLASQRAALAYRVAAHVAVLGWLWRELAMLPDGAAYVTVAWGLYAAGLFVAGLRLDRAMLVRGGMATLFLVVGKLFLVDLAGVEAVWRILLFLGFGGLFLVLSYYIGSLWRSGGSDGTVNRES